MTINLKKGQRINLKKVDNKGIQQFCVACRWSKYKGSKFIFFTEEQDVDLDLSCVLFDDQDQLIDYIYSNLYKIEFLSRFGYSKGKLKTNEGALSHSGDDLEGGSNDEDNEIITVDLTKINKNVKKIVFFLNYVDSKRIDLSKLSFFQIRLFEGQPNKCIKEYLTYKIDATTTEQYVGKTALIMGGLVKEKGEWDFKAIGLETADKHLCETMNFIKENIKTLFKD